MLTIVYDSKNGCAFRDGEAEFIANEWVKMGEGFLVTSSHLFIDWLRVAISEKRLSVSNVEVYYRKELGSKPHRIPILPDGQFQEWPIGFCDHTEKALCRIIY